MNTTQNVLAQGFYEVCSTNQNSPQNIQTNTSDRPFKNTVTSLRNEFKEGRNDVISSLISTTLERLRTDYPNLNERKDHLRGLFGEVKKQRMEGCRSLPSLQDDLSCRILNLLTLEETDTVLPGGHAPVRNIVWLPMTFASAEESKLTHSQNLSSSTPVYGNDFGELDNPWAAESSARQTKVMG